MLNGIHFLLTNSCNYECDHCFLYCSSRAEGTFTLRQLRHVFDEIGKIGSIDEVYFEGGEPFLYYPLMVEGLKMAAAAGLRAGIVTNGYWATSVEDAMVWLKPIAAIDKVFLSISDDQFHYFEEMDNPAKKAAAAALKLGMSASSICIEKPSVEGGDSAVMSKGAPVIGGGVKFRGRAAEKLTAGLPTRPWESFIECPYEDLAGPGRVHLDPFGNVHLCQGISMGNCLERPLSELIENHDPLVHPITGPLLKGGPAELARKYDVIPDFECVEECHFCYSVRKSLLDKFPQYLAPKQVYGIEDSK